MFYVTNEMDEVKGLRGRNGFHFYPLSDKASIGFRFIWKNTNRIFRFSKTTKKFHFQYIKVTDEDIRKNNEFFSFKE